jgi:hypothetical protein
MSGAKDCLSTLWLLERSSRGRVEEETFHRTRAGAEALVAQVVLDFWAEDVGGEPPGDAREMVAKYLEAMPEERFEITQLFLQD